MAESVHTLVGVFLPLEGVFWFQADQTTNTVVSVSSDSIQVSLEDDEVTVYLEGGA